MASSIQPERTIHSRRWFLGRMGMGAAGAVLAAGRGFPIAPASAEVISASSPFAPLFFGRIFNLPPFLPATTPGLIAALNDIGKPGGILDAKDDLAAGAKALITDPAVNGNNPPTNPDNPTMTAGSTFFGQFVDHDITFDADSVLGQPTEPTTTHNHRSPVLDLDSVYGRGPSLDPQLYDPTDTAKLLIAFGGLFEDLPRVYEPATGTYTTAIIADPRNDENLMIAGLHCAFIKFHNNAVDLVRARGTTGADGGFAAARQLMTWHYHWLLLHQFLPQFVGQPMVDDILNNGRRYFTPALGQAYMPVEFQGACYRFGHSMVRPSYRANLAGDNGNPFFGLVFDGTLQEPLSDPSDLRGGHRAPRRFVGWQTFFDFGDGQVKHNKQVDTKISTALFNLPLGAIASHQPPVALPQRNLLRQVTWSMPSGQAIAHVMDVDMLTLADLTELRVYGLGLEKNTPLWYYALKEAQLVASGYHLGPVGGRIVGEVLIGLLQTDPGSWLASQPGWQPTLPTSTGHPADFNITDLLRFAQVDPVSRGQ